MMGLNNKSSWSIRDGTSQSERLPKELDPEYVQVDERTTRDLLAFAREYARELKYFSTEDPKHAGDWSNFIGTDIDLDDVIHYLSEPETFPSEKAAAFSRPHFALFLTFLELLEHSRVQLNKLTQRHLEFFYHDVLKMVRKRAIPDRVHVLVDLDSGAEQLALPKATALRAGKDSLGQDLIYHTGPEFIANKVEVAQLSSLHAQIKITGIKEACPPNRVGGNRKEAFVAMLRIALGQPDPGDPLPLPIYADVPPKQETEAKVNYEVLLQAQKLIAVVDTELYISESGIPLFDDFRLLMRLKRQRQQHNEADWKQINLLLEKAYTTRTGKTDFKINPEHAGDFAENLRAVLGLSAEDFDTLFNRLPEVNSVEDAYAVYLKRTDVATFIQPPTESAEVPIKSLYLSLDEFKAMMQIKVAMDSQWQAINQLLETAGKRKEINFAFEPAVLASQDFDSKLTAALATPDYTVEGGLDGYFAAFRAVEQYFYMSAESFNYIMSVVMRKDVSVVDESAWGEVYQWDKVYQIVATAHQEMIYTRRRTALRNIAQPDINIAITDKVSVLNELLAVVLDEKLQLDEALQKLVAFGIVEKDQIYLSGIEDSSEAIDWERVYKVLEVAQRNRENMSVPIAEKIEWLNLYPAVDAKQVLVQSEKPDDETLPRWKTFGEGQPDETIESVPDAVLGWAMASPLLALSEGKRTITLLLGFSADADKFDVNKIRDLFAQYDDSEFVANFNPFQIQLSTTKGWLEAESVTISWADTEMTYPEVKDVDTSKLRGLVLQITLSPDQPELVPLTAEVHSVDTTVPVLRLMLKPVWDEKESRYVTSSYTTLRHLLLMRAQLTVAVEGLASLHVSNDQSTLDAKKPFEPFTSEPNVGSRFYLGHAEIVTKKLDSLSFNIDWMGAPSNLSSLDKDGHYKNYPSKLENKSFTAKVSLVEGNVLRDFPVSLSLFNPKNATDTSTVANKLTPPEDQGNPERATVVADDVTEWNRYLQWELTPNDFQHSIYTTVALQKSLEMAAAVANKPASGGDVGGAEKYQVKLPYTPKIKSLSLDYSASAELLLESTANEITAMHAYHIGPFGFAELQPESVQAGCLFLPRYDFEGELYIGLRNVTAPQNLSLLFQVAEGSADPDLKPEPVQWSYLSGNQWRSLQEDGSLVADGTRGLINSGIVELALKPVQPNTLLPAELYWIRVAITRSAKSVCDMVEIHPNAVLATFVDKNNAVDHLSAPLAAESITAPLEPIVGVTGLRQPYTSFDGKMAEQDSNFYVRVSERLRHKRRALTPWDYERLVLEKFPQIYKAKCLSADPLNHSHDPGKIEMVVIPDIRNRLPFNPFEPKAPANQIRDIQTFLQDKTPPFVHVEVSNAHYIPVMVRCGVRFLPGQDIGFCRRRLNEELNRFLSPWAYEEGADLVIGGSVYANSIINFIDRQDYVDYLAGFKMFLGEGKVAIAETDDGYHASADRPDGVLVAARQHIFDVITDTDYRVEEFSGINYMKIELDFTVA